MKALVLSSGGELADLDAGAAQAVAWIPLRHWHWQ